MKDAAKTLIVPPYLGEFGWELMNWQGRVRWIVQHGGHDRIIVCATPDRRPIYCHFAGERNVIHCPVSQMEWPGVASEDHRIDENRAAIDPDRLRRVVCDSARHSCLQYGIDTEGADFLIPDYRASLWPTDRAHQSFAELRQSTATTTDILLIPRDRAVAADRNQTCEWWDELSGRLRSSGLSVEFYTPRLDEAIRQLSRARLAVGASTGGLHLASLCRCPHYVWGSGAEARWTGLGITNRQRYQTIWNPFGTPCRYDECGWRPSIEHVHANVVRALSAIGLPRGAKAPTWSLKPMWRIKRRLAGFLDGQHGMLPWPWTFRQFVKEHIV